MNDVSLELATTEQIALELKKRCALFALVAARFRPLPGGQDVEIAMFTGGPRKEVISVMREALGILKNNER